MKLFPLFLLLRCALAAEPAKFDDLWNYHEPKDTEAKFRALLPEAEKGWPLDSHLQLLTQIGRTLSLQKKFGEAHDILNGVEARIGKATPVAEIRYLLERGRTFNSGKRVPEAIPVFRKAFDLAVERKQDFHAIDAAHMLAIAEKAPEKQLEWNERALKMAESSADPRARRWLASLYNNIGWSYHDSGRFEQALEIFRKAQALREEGKNDRDIREAKWMVARALRSLKRYSEAMAIQRALEGEWKASGGNDGYVFEEIAELLLLQGQEKEAKPYFALAYGLLSQDIWLKDNEPKRIARLKELGGS